MTEIAGSIHYNAITGELLGSYRDYEAPYIERTAIPKRSFAGWLYAEKDDNFPHTVDKDLPDIIKTRKLTRVGFVPYGHTINPQNGILYNRTMYKVNVINLEDFEDHTFDKRGKVKGWILVKWPSDSVSDSEKSKSA